jgi:SAM-dependent methyltransferase
LRFQKLAQVIDTPTGKITVNDRGCGYGAMFKYLDIILDVQLTKYYGYDISKEMLSVANKYVADERAEWIHSKDITSKADYSFVSGTFNVRFEASDVLWTQYIQETVIQLGKMSRKGFAFNLLSTYVDWKEDHLYYGDPLFFFDFCKRNLSHYVSLLHDYPLYEWTILIKMEN